MRKSKIFFSVLFFLTSCYASKSFAAETSPDSQIPDWIKRTNFSVQAESDTKTKYFIETIQPLLGTQDADTVLFTQARAAARGNRGIYNLGAGARKILNESLLVGVNTFYDYQDYHQHHRAGVGFEMITERGLEGRINTYFRVSDIRQIEENAGGQNFEKVANGLDWEFGGPVPHLSLLKLYAGGYWYSFERFTDKCGWKARAEYNPVKYSRLMLEMFDDNKRGKLGCRVEGTLTFAFTSFALKDILNDLKATEEMFPKIDLRDKMLDRVVRDFDITVISSTKTTKGLVVEGGRS